MDSSNSLPFHSKAITTIFWFFVLNSSIDIEEEGGKAAAGIWELASSLLQASLGHRCSVGYDSLTEHQTMSV